MSADAKDTGGGMQDPLSVADFDYELPDRLVAQQPMEPRDHSRLLVVHRDSGAIEHHHFYDLPTFLNEGDILVINETRVIPARLFGTKRVGGGRVEILLVRPLLGTGEGIESNERMWTAMVRPSRRVSVGSFVVLDAPGEPVVVVGQDYSDGTRLVTLPEGLSLQEIGQAPLPSYIREGLQDAERYQTIYASKPGSVAAPTAGLHFTPELLDRLADKGVGLAKLTLDVGPGTFRPVRVEDPREHDMGPERYDLPEEAVQLINRARSGGGRVISVGSTSVRALESAALNQGLKRRSAGTSELTAEAGETQLMILPGFEFKVADVMVSNFHLPRSTLLMLVSAFAGKALTERVYQEAVQREYRFYSFGDAMIAL